jgi:hypothetical protein
VAAVTERACLVPRSRRSEIKDRRLRDTRVSAGQSEQLRIWFVQENQAAAGEGAFDVDRWQLVSGPRGGIGRARPDVILASGNAAAAPLLQVTRVNCVCDCSRSGRRRLSISLARPGGPPGSSRSDMSRSQRKSAPELPGQS